jgi:5-(carboxyamino)imidazole ribonucleotide mutase
VNAGVLAAEILALKYPELKKTLIKHKADLAKGVEDKDLKLQKKGIKKYLEDKGRG